MARWTGRALAGVILKGCQRGGRVVMPGAVIERGAQVKRAIVAEHAVIGAGAVVGEDSGDIAVVGEKVVLPPGAFVKAGEQRDR